jgi:hypothetical protein
MKGNFNQSELQSNGGLQQNSALEAQLATMMGQLANMLSTNPDALAPVFQY